MREMILAMRAIWNTWQNGDKLDFRGEFYTHTLMTPFFTPDRARPRRVRRAEGLPRRRRRADDRGRRRGVRRLHLPRLHHREVPPRGHDPRARARPRQGRQDDGGLRDRRAVVRRHRQQRRGDRRPPPPAPASRSRSTASTPAYRGVLETPRLGRPAGRAEHALQAGRVGGDGHAHRRRDPQHVRRRRRARADRPGAAPPLRRRDPADQLLRALHERPRALGAGDRRPPRRLSSSPKRSITA